MAFSRLRRHTEKEQKRRLFVGIAGSLAVLAFLFLFGVRILIGFSLLVDRIRGGGTPETGVSETIILPPILSPLPEATPSSALTVTGTGQAGTTVILYVNGGEEKKAPINAGGTFSFPDVKLTEGTNTISAKLKGQGDQLSELSNVLTVLVKRTPPPLDVTSPQENAVVRGDSNLTQVAGKTEEGASVSVNGRFVVVRTDGTFAYDYPLENGDNTLKIIAVDAAGNQTTVERHVRRE